MDTFKAPHEVHSTLPAMEEIRRYEAPERRLFRGMINFALAAGGIALLVVAGINQLSNQ